MARSIDNPWKAWATWSLSVQLRQVKQWKWMKSFGVALDQKMSKAYANSGEDDAVDALCTFAKRNHNWPRSKFGQIRKQSWLFTWVYLSEARSAHLHSLIQPALGSFWDQGAWVTACGRSTKWQLAAEGCRTHADLCRNFVHVLKHNFEDADFSDLKPLSSGSFNIRSKSRAFLRKHLALDSDVVSWKSRQEARCQVWHSA